MSDHVSVDLGSCGIVSGELQHVARAVEIHRYMRALEEEWIAGLRALGVKAAHPDDGWVKRDENKVHLVYPQFGSYRSLEIGDLMALGWPRSPVLDRVDRHRIVRVIGLLLHPLRGDFLVFDREEIAREFHEAYERLAPSYVYETRRASAVPWRDVPANNRDLMIAVVWELLDRGIIQSGIRLTR